MERSDHCYASRSLGIASLRGTFLSTRCFAARGVGYVPHAQIQELWCGIPHPLVLLEGRSSASQVPREPSCAPALLSDPAEACSKAVHEQGAADRTSTRAALGLSISRLDDTAFTLPVYASQRRVAPSPRKTRFWRSPTLPGGVGYPLGSDSRFPVSRYLLSSSLDIPT